MWRLSWRNVRAHPVRVVTTMLAILVGTGFLGGALVMRDSIAVTFEANTNAALVGVDAAVEPPRVPQAGGGSQRGGQANGFSHDIDAPVLASVQSVPGVAGAAGVLSGEIGLLDAQGKQTKPLANGSLYIPVAQLNPYQLVTGGWPTGPGQIAIDDKAARDKGISLGASLPLATTSGKAQGTVTGTVRYGLLPTSGDGPDIIVNPTDAFSWLANGKSQYHYIYVAAAPGTSQPALAGAISTKIGASGTVKTGDDFRRQQAGDSAGLADAIGIGLQVFAYVALVICIFIVYNTFTTIVAQRVRELALLRAIGASGRQVRRAVRNEALILGLIASAVGFALGVGLAFLLTKAAPGLVSLGSGQEIGVNVKPTTMLQVLLSGTVITVVSAVIPSFRASRVRPIEAMREASVDRSHTSRLRARVGIGAIGIGAVLLLAGSFARVLLMLPAGSLLLFVGVLFAGPTMAAGFARMAAPVVAIGGRITSRLASDNVERNPRRTATTANALVIGVFLVVFVTAAGGALRDFAVVTVGKLGGADLMVDSNGTPIPLPLQQAIQATPGVTGSVAVYDSVGTATFGEDPLPVGAVDFSKITSATGLKPVQGSFSGLHDNQIIIMDLLTKGKEPLSIGSPITVTYTNGQKRDYTVGATFPFSLTLQPFIVSQSAMLSVLPDEPATSFAVTNAPGQGQQVKTRIEDLTADYTNISVSQGNSIAEIMKVFFNALISVVSALLGVAVVIAVFGIVNTLMLAVTERTHEIGLLRAVGMERRQVRAEIRTEAVIVSLLGTIIGTAGGLFVALAITHPLLAGDDSGGLAVSTPFSWPLRELAVIALLSIVVGVVASLIPAWRASRLDVLTAIRSE